MKLVEEADPRKVGPADFTGEGLISLMRHRKKGTDRNRLILPMKEFGAYLSTTSTYGSGTGTILCALYDGDDYERVRSGKRPLLVEKPRLSILGGCAYEMLAKYGDEREWNTGFFARFLFVVSNEQSRRPRFEEQPVTPRAELDACRARLVDLTRELEETKAPFEVMPAASKILREFSRSIPDNDTDTAASAARERLLNALWKVAMLYQIDVNPQAHIGEVAAEAACGFIRKCWEGFLTVKGVTSGSADSKLIDRLWRFIDRAGEAGVSKRNVLMNFKERADRIDPALKVLIGGEVVELRQQGRTTMLVRREPYNSR